MLLLMMMQIALYQAMHPLKILLRTSARLEIDHRVEIVASTGFQEIHSGSRLSAMSVVTKLIFMKIKLVPPLVQTSHSSILSLRTDQAGKRTLSTGTPVL